MDLSENNHRIGLAHVYPLNMVSYHFRLPNQLLVSHSQASCCIMLGTLLNVNSRFVTIAFNTILARFELNTRNKTSRRRNRVISQRCCKMAVVVVDVEVIITFVPVTIFIVDHMLHPEHATASNKN